MDKNRVEGAAKSVAGKAEAAYGRVAGDAATEASGRGHDAAGAAQRIYGQAVDAANDLGDAASGFAKQAIDAGRDLYRDGSRAVSSTVKNQPLGALLAAGAVGFALAMMIKREPPRRRLRWSDLRDLRDIR